MNAIFATAQEDQFSRAKAEQLSADFRTNATTGSGDQNPSAPNQLDEPICVQKYRLTLKQVIDVQGA